MGEKTVQKKKSGSNISDLTGLRYHVTEMVRIWKTLNLIKGTRSEGICQVMQDLCSSRLRGMIYELLEGKHGSVTFKNQRINDHRYQKLYNRLAEISRVFEIDGYHARNCSVSHLHPPGGRRPVRTNVFQAYGLADYREYKTLTKGVAICIKLLKILDSTINTKVKNKYWKDVRIKFGHEDEITRNDALLLSYQR